MLKVKTIKKEISTIKTVLTNKMVVDSIDVGISKHGGVTKLEGNNISHFFDDTIQSITKSKVYTLRLYIPTTYNCHERASHVLLMTNIHNCNTLIKDRYKVIPRHISCLGYWQDEQKNLCKEDICLLEVKLHNLQISDIRFFAELSRMIHDDMRQESVCFTVNNCMFMT